MKKIFLTLALVVCSMSAFSQFIQQGTLIDTNEYEDRKVDIPMRKGWDGSFGLGAGVSGYDMDAFLFRLDLNYGYNVTPWFYLGAGVSGHFTEISMAAVYINPRIYFSKRINSMYLDLNVGTTVASSVDADWDEYEYYSYDSFVYKASGLYAGVSLGYRFDNWELEAGMRVYNTKYGDAEKYDGEVHYDWADTEEYEYDEWFDPSGEFFLRMAFHF